MKNYFCFKTFFLGVLLSSVILLVTACPEAPSPKPSTSNNDLDSLIVDFANLPVLDPSYVYEGWIIIDGSPVSTGRFPLDHDASNPLVTVKPYKKTYAIDKAKLEKAAAFVLSIEPKEDSDPKPSAVKLLGGDFSANVANAVMSHKAAFGASFIDNLKKTKMSYKLATPTDNDGTNERSGIWFIKDGPAAGLENLPALPTGWKYEGWLVVNGNPLKAGINQPFPLTTGKFVSASGIDEFKGFSGTDNAGPKFPGEDFLNNAPMGVGITFPLSINEKDAVVISIEPNPDDSPAPFAFKPFVGFFENDVTSYSEKGMYAIGLDPKNPEIKGTATRQ